MSVRLQPRAAKVIVGITGASGAPYAARLIAQLKQVPDLEVAGVLSSTAPQVWALEVGGSPKDMLLCYEGRDYSAPFASGSAQWDSMVVIPCSMGCLSRIAHGTSESLLTRAADVILKERRRLIVVPRESPYSLIHLENMTKLARLGATIMPASPSFYADAHSIDNLLDSVVGRVLDHLGINHQLLPRWGSKDHVD